MATATAEQLDQLLEKWDPHASMYELDVESECALDGYPVFGAITTTEAMAAVLGGAPEQVTASRQELLSTPLFSWQGHIPGRKKNGIWEPGPAGIYTVPNPYRSEAIIRLASVPKRGESTGQPRGLDAVLKYRGGLTKDDIGTNCVAMAEADEGTVAEQLDNLLSIERDADLEWASLHLSGDIRRESIIAAGLDPGLVQLGKSVHGFIAMYPTDLSIFTAIQETACVLLRSDPAIINRDRLMRLPGALGTRPPGNYDNEVRLQTCLRVRHAVYRGEDVLNRLQSLARSRGIPDVRASFRIVQKADETSKLAERLVETHPEEAKALREIASVSRSSLTLSDAADDYIAEVKKRCFGVQVVKSRATRDGRMTAIACTHATIPATTEVILADGSTVMLRDAASLPLGGARCFDPILESPGSSSPSGRLFPNGNLFSESGGGRTVYRAEGAADTASGDLDDFEIDTLEDFLATPGSESGHEGEEPPDVLQVERERQINVIIPELYEMYGEKMSKKHEEARKVDPTLSKIARDIIMNERGPVASIRRRWRDAGAPKQPGCGARTQQLVNVSLSERAGLHLYRGLRCGDIHCRICGPEIAYRKAMASVRLQVVRDGVPVGAALRDRPVFVYVMAKAEFDAWSQRFRDQHKPRPRARVDIHRVRELEAEGRTRKEIAAVFGVSKRTLQRALQDARDFGPCQDVTEVALMTTKGGGIGQVRSSSDTPQHEDVEDGVHSYVKLESPERDEVVVLSSKLMDGGRLVNPASLEAGWLELVISYLGPGSWGKMTSSNGLRLRPKDIVATAFPAEYVVERDEGLLSPPEIEQVLSEDGRLQVAKTTVEGDLRGPDRGYDRVTTAVFPPVSAMTAAERAEFAARLSEPTYMPISNDALAIVMKDDVVAKLEAALGGSPATPATPATPAGPTPAQMKQLDELVKTLL